MVGRFFLLLLFCLSFVEVIDLNALDNMEKEQWRERAMERIMDFIEQGGDDPSGKSGDDYDLSAAFEYLEGLLVRPMPINAATRNDLEKLLVLSRFQIESILDYRCRSGNILSTAELSLLHGFDEEIAALLAPFLSFEPFDYSVGKIDDEQNLFKRFLNNGDGQIYLKGATDFDNKDVIGTPYHMQLRYKGKYLARASWGITLENDEGELFLPKSGPPVDFFSFNVALENRGCMNSLVIGDYSARLGQGLVLWKSFNIGGGYAPSSIYKRGAAVVPYSSTDENNFLRGAAASFSFGKLDVNALFSFNGVDARVENGKYRSIVEGGLHNTLPLLKCRNSMNEYLGGLSLSYLFRRFELGVSAVGYGYNRRNGSKISEYNKYQFYDGMWGNASVDFYGVWQNLRLFGELAIDMGGSCAFLLGTIFPVSDGVEIGALLRSHSKSYIAPHASAYSTLSSVSNQTGIKLHSLWKLASWAKLYLFAEAVYYPWKRYNIHTSSYMFRESLKFEVENDNIDGYMTLSHNFYSHKQNGRYYLKYKINCNFSHKVRGTFHGALVTTSGAGYELGTSFKYKSENGRFGTVAGCSLFDCKEWENRLYIYENDLPYTYSSRLLYGTGLSAYFLVDYKFSQYMELYLKNGTLCHFDNDRESESELKIALKINF